MGFRINIELDEPAAIETILDKVFDRIEKRDRALAEIDASGEAARLEQIVKTFEKLPAIMVEAMKALHPPGDTPTIPRRGMAGLSGLAGGVGGVGGVVPFPSYKPGPPSEQDLTGLSTGVFDDLSPEASEEVFEGDPSIPRLVPQEDRIVNKDGPVVE